MKVSSQSTGTRRRGAAKAVFTIGYEGRTVAELVTTLQASGVEQLIDVRHNALSRKKGFSKSALSSACEQGGIAYVHVKELGIPSSLRKNLDSPAAYERLFTVYANELLPAAKSFVELATDLVQERTSALLCFERAATCCHRGHLASEVSRATGYNVQHL